jgi:hypothetical protein
MEIDKGKDDKQTRKRKGKQKREARNEEKAKTGKRGKGRGVNKDERKRYEN